MKRLPLLVLQGAIYARLAAQLTVPVYDQVPESVRCPYVTVGEDTTVDWASKTTNGQEVTHTLHVWSQHPGMREIKALMDEIVRILTVSPLDLTAHGFRVVVQALDGGETMRDPDGVTRHGVLRLRWRIQEV